MENGIVLENGVCHTDTGNGGQYIWSCENGVSSSSSADHLVVMVHGILGSAADWKFGAEQFVKMLPDKVYVHCSQKNGATLTLDGVDVMAQRLATEVLEIIKQKPNLSKISIVAHSVGGLVARYAIGILYQPPKGINGDDSSIINSHENARGTIGGLEAVNFITVATPHLGSRGNKQVPFLFGVTAIEKVAGRVIHWIFRKTGRHLFLTDGDDQGKPPLLKRMVEDNSEYCFISALRAFRRRVAYSNVGYDHIVGWRTSCIRRMNELPKWEDSLNEKYPHVVYEELCEAREPNEASAEEDHCCDKIEEELVTGLSRVPWEKVDVSFHSSRMRFAAHSVIQVKDHYMHTEGADVIQHMIDHFVI